MIRSGFRVQGAAFRVLMVLALSTVVSAHIGSPDVFFTGKAGAYDISVVVRPPQVVPGVAIVTVHTPRNVTGVSIRPVYWRAGSKGAPAADALPEHISRMADGKGEMQRDTKEFNGSLWLMARGAYSVDVSVTGLSGVGSVLVPVASVATGRLALNTPLAAVLVVLGAFLLTGFVNIVRKSAGESLLAPGKSLNDDGIRMSRVAGGIAVVVMAVALFGGARWWDAVDGDYQRTMYRPSPLALSLREGVLTAAASDTQYMPNGQPSSYVPDHGKLMHLFLVGDRGFAHLHPLADNAVVPSFTTRVPPLPPGTYRVYGDVVQETGFERTMVGSLTIPEKMPTSARADADDAWLVGDVTSPDSARLEDGTFMHLDVGRPPLVAGTEVELRAYLRDSHGKAVPVQPYLGMAGHAVVMRADGQVYVHLHPMGTVTAAAQDVFQARDRGDTTASGSLRLPATGARAGMGTGMTAAMVAAPSVISFPYAFPREGAYRVYVQVRHAGHVQTGAFAVTVVAPPMPAK